MIHNDFTTHLKGTWSNAKKTEPFFKFYNTINQNRLKNGIIIKKGRFVSLQVYDMTILLLKPQTAAKKKLMKLSKRGEGDTN